MSPDPLSASSASGASAENPNPTDTSATSPNSTAPAAFKNPLRQYKPVVSEVKKNWRGKEIIYWQVKVGSSVTKVHATPTGKRIRFSIAYWMDGQRKRELFNSKEEAIEAAKGIGVDLGKPDFGGAGITGTLKLACERALQELEPIGVPIDTAAREYAQAMKLLKHVPLIRAVDFYLSRCPLDMPDKTVREAANELLAAKVADQLSKRYQKQLRYDMDRFCERFKGLLQDVKGVDVEKWLRDQDVGPRTRNNLRSSVSGLFKFGVTRKYLPKDHDEISAVPVAKDMDGEIEIFTPQEMAEILAVASPEHVPFLAISAFAGVRHAEINRLDWANVNRKAKIIEIKAGTAKTASRRVIPIVPNLLKWLKTEKREFGPVSPYANMVLQFVELTRRVNEKRRAAWAKANKIGKKELVAADGRAEERLSQLPRSERRSRGTAIPKGADTAAEEGWTPFKWKHNALRHSFISYRVADKKNIAEVSLEAGNSPQMIFQHYREVVTADEAKAWFGIVPSSEKIT